MVEVLAKEAEKAGLGLALRHWRVWDWLHGKLSRATLARGTKMPISLRELWDWVSRDYLTDGDYLELKPRTASGTCWYITEWVPRLPGQVWFEDPIAADARLIEMDPDAIRNALDLKTAGKLMNLCIGRHDHWGARFYDLRRVERSLIDQGLALRAGIARPALSTSEDRFALMSIVTAKEFFVDLGFPVIVSRPVYRKILNARRHNMAVEIEGNMHVREVSPSKHFDLFLAAHNAPQEDVLRAHLSRPIGIRMFVGEVLSPLDIRVKPFDRHPTGTIRVDGHDGNVLAARAGTILISRFLVDDPSQIPNLLSLTHFLLGEDYQFGTQMVPVTDFDARLTRFASSVPLVRDPTKDETVTTDIIDSISS